MLFKAILNPKFIFIALKSRFSSISLEEANKIDKIIKALNSQSLASTIEKNGHFYVNKMDGLCKLMDSGSSLSIFRPRRMGKEP